MTESNLLMALALTSSPWSLSRRTGSRWDPCIGLFLLGLARCTRLLGMGNLRDVGCGRRRFFAITRGGFGGGNFRASCISSGLRIGRGGRDHVSLLLECGGDRALCTRRVEGNSRLWRRFLGIGRFVLPGMRLGRNLGDLECRRLGNSGGGLCRMGLTGECFCGLSWGG